MTAEIELLVEDAVEDVVVDDAVLEEVELAVDDAVLEVELAVDVVDDESVLVAVDVLAEVVVESEVLEVESVVEVDSDVEVLVAVDEVDAVVLELSSRFSSGWTSLSSTTTSSAPSTCSSLPWHRLDAHTASTCACSWVHPAPTRQSCKRASWDPVCATQSLTVVAPPQTI